MIPTNPVVFVCVCARYQYTYPTECFQYKCMLCLILSEFERQIKYTLRFAGIRFAIN